MTDSFEPDVPEQEAEETTRPVEGSKATQEQDTDSDARVRFLLERTKGLGGIMRAL